MNARTRKLVWSRAGHRCEYCRIHQEDEPFYRLHVEHIVAKQHGGTDDAENLALACRPRLRLEQPVEVIAHQTIGV